MAGGERRIFGIFWVAIGGEVCYKYALNGAVAQLGARLNGIQKVVGSTPISSIFFLFWL